MAVAGACAAGGGVGDGASGRGVDAAVDPADVGGAGAWPVWASWLGALGSGVAVTTTSTSTCLTTSSVTTSGWQPNKAMAESIKAKSISNLIERISYSSYSNVANLSRRSYRGKNMYQYGIHYRVGSSFRQIASAQVEPGAPGRSKCPCSVLVPLERPARSRTFSMARMVARPRLMYHGRATTQKRRRRCAAATTFVIPPIVCIERWSRPQRMVSFASRALTSRFRLTPSSAALIARAR